MSGKIRLGKAIPPRPRLFWGRCKRIPTFASKGFHTIERNTREKYFFRILVYASKRKEEGRGKIKEYFRKRALSRSCAQWSINGKETATTQRDKGKEKRINTKGKYSVGEIGMYKHVFFPPRMDFRSPPDKYTEQYFLFFFFLF